MLKKLKTAQIMDSIWILLFLFAIGGFMLANTGPAFMDAIKGPTPLTADVDLREAEGTYVSWEVCYPIVEYMETTKNTRINGVSTGEKKSRSSWLAIDLDRGIPLSVEVPAKRYDEIAAQSDRFYDALSRNMEPAATGIQVAGSLTVLDSEELRYFNAATDYFDYPNDAVVYQITDGRIRGDSMTNIYGITALGLIFILLGLYILIKTLRDSAKKLVGEYLAAHPDVTMEELESDFNSASQTAKLWIGRRWTFGAKLSKLLFENNQVIWVHSGSVRRGRSINFYVWWEMLDGSRQEASFSSEKKCAAVLEQYQQFSHIVVGNNPEYTYLIQNDREAFLNLKYRNTQN